MKNLILTVFFFFFKVGVGFRVYAGKFMMGTDMRVLDHYRENIQMNIISTIKNYLRG